MEGVRGLTLTQNKGSNEGSSHAAGTKQDSVIEVEVSVGDPAEHHRCDRGQEANYSSLNLRINTKRITGAREEPPPRVPFRLEQHQQGNTKPDPWGEPLW